MSTAEETRAVVRRLIEAYNACDLSAIDELIGPDFAINGRPASHAELKAWWTNIHTAFPDLHFTIEEELYAGDRGMIRGTARGTHQGEWPLRIGDEVRVIPPTGKRVGRWVVYTGRVAGGKLVEEWTGSDTAGSLLQLGAEVRLPG